MNPRKNVGVKRSAMRSHVKQTAQSNTQKPAIKRGASSASSRDSQTQTQTHNPQHRTPQSLDALPVPPPQRPQLLHSSVIKPNQHNHFIPENPNRQPPPYDACKSCTSTREKGAKLWAICNIVATFLNLIYKIVDLVFATGGPELRSSTYNAFFEVWYCPRNGSNNTVSAVMDFLAVVIYLAGSVIFVVSTWWPKLQTHLRINLAMFYQLMCQYGCWPLVIGPKILTYVFRVQCHYEMGETMFILTMLLVSILLIAWCLYGMLVAQSFIWSLKHEQLVEATTAAAEGPLDSSDDFEEEVYDVLVRKSIVKLERAGDGSSSSGELHPHKPKKSTVSTATARGNR